MRENLMLIDSPADVLPAERVKYAVGDSSRGGYLDAVVVELTRRRVLIEYMDRGGRPRRSSVRPSRIAKLGA